MSGNGATRLGMVRCEHCQRQFNPHSAARHIPWCKKQQSDAKKRRLTADKLEALERYRWRIGYKPSNKINQRPDSRPSEGRLQQNGPGQTKSRSSINSTATLSSPSASSTTSLSASIASTNERHYHGQGSKQHANTSGAGQSLGRFESKPNLNDKLKRSASSVTLTKQRCNGSASSRNSRISTTTTCLGRIDSEDAQNRQLDDSTPTMRRQMRAKSVSDLTNMGEIVETLAKRMEEIYAQNQLLLETIMRHRQMNGRDAGMKNGRCDSETQAAERKDTFDDDDCESNSYGEFAQCHHCRVRCPIEANYCHKCGCKMRPSNPTPPLPD